MLTTEYGITSSILELDPEGGLGGGRVILVATPRRQVPEYGGKQLGKGAGDYQLVPSDDEDTPQHPATKGGSYNLKLGGAGGAPDTGSTDRQRLQACMRACHCKW